jgi:hypothetical protein
LRAQLYHRGLPEAKAIADYQLPMFGGTDSDQKQLGLGIAGVSPARGRSAKKFLATDTRRCTNQKQLTDFK